MENEQQNDDPVYSPSHYNKGRIEVIEFIEDQNFDYHTGNAIKYLCRHEHKGNKVQDLEKAIWYIKRKISLVQLDTGADKIDENPLVEKPYEHEEMMKVPVEVLVSRLKSLKPKEPEIRMVTEHYENHTLKNCKWGGCFKCDPEGHKI